jgi:hypothetical protein
MDFIECTCVVVIFYIIMHESKIAFRSYLGLKSTEEIFDENNKILKNTELEIYKLKYELEQLKYDLKIIDFKLKEIKIDLS